MGSVWGGGGMPESGEQRKGVGGTFGRRTPLHTATFQELLDGTHSDMQNFKRREGQGVEGGLAQRMRGQRLQRARRLSASRRLPLPFP